MVVRLDPIIDKYIKEYAQESGINGDNIYWFSQRTIALVNEIFKQACDTADYKGEKKAIYTFSPTSEQRNSSYHSLIQDIIRSAWGLTIEKTSEKIFYGLDDYFCVNGITWADFHLTWSSINEPISFLKPTFEKPPVYKDVANEVGSKNAFPFDPMKIFQTYRQQNEMIDVVLHCGDHQFPAHRLILAAHSKVFKAAFENGMKESRLFDYTIDLQGLESGPQHLGEFLDFLYTGQIDLKNKSIEDIKKTLALAHCYNVESLLMMCIYELSERLNEESVQKIYDIGKKYGILKLTNLCNWYTNSPVAHLKPLETPSK